MSLRSRTLKIGDIAVPIMIIGTIAFLDIQIICLGSQAVALFIMVLVLFKHGAVLRGEYRNYFIWALILLLYCFFSCFWAARNNLTAFSCSISVLQGCLMGFTVLYMTDSVNKIDGVIKAFTIAGIIISLRFFLQVPISFWGKETRFDNIPLFRSNYTAVFLAYIAGIIFYRILKDKHLSTAKCGYNIFLILLFMFISIMTGTKKGILVFGTIVLLTFILSSTNPIKLIIRIALGALGVFLVYYLIMNIELFYGAIGYRFEKMVYQYLGINGVADGSTRERLAFARDALDVFKNHPFFGVGLDGYRYLNRIQFTYSHNNYIELLADIGIIGFSIYYSKYLALLATAIKKIKNNQLLFSILAAMIIADFGTVSYSAELQHILLGFVIAMVQVDAAFESSSRMTNEEEPTSLARLS